MHVAHEPAAQHHARHVEGRRQPRRLLGSPQRPPHRPQRCAEDQPKHRKAGQREGLVAGVGGGDVAPEEERQGHRHDEEPDRFTPLVAAAQLALDPPIDVVGDVDHRVGGRGRPLW